MIPAGSGGRDRTDDILVNSQAHLPTELPRKEVGGPGETRTRAPRVNSHAALPLSY